MRRPPFVAGSAEAPHGRSPADISGMRKNAAQMLEQARDRMMKMSPEERATVREKFRKSRDARRSAKVANLKLRWGEILQRPQALAELKVNADRTARLQRAQALAEDSGNIEVHTRVLALLKREQQRHLEAMQRLHLPPGGPNNRGAAPAPLGTPAAPAQGAKQEQTP